MKTEKRVGFVLNEKDDPKSWKLGATELPKVVLRPDGDWEDFLPIKESQVAGGYETWSCTVQGTENAQQILENFHLGETKEYDERYNYNLAGINPPGADPHDVAETFRLKGVVFGVYPIPDTYEEYARPRPIPNDVQNQGMKHPWELRHQWLWRSNAYTKEHRTELIREHLKYGPLGVSVTAWHKKNGVYVDNGRPNTHWTIIYGEGKNGWKVFDSYSPHKKILSFDHNIEACKRYQLVPSIRQIRMSLLQRVALLLKEILENMTTKSYDVPPGELPMNQPDVKKNI